MAKYLYNGVELPELPSGYENRPYATIVAFGDSYKLKLSDIPFFASPGEGTVGLANYYKDKGIIYADFSLINDKWVLNWTYSVGINKVATGSSTEYVWVNYDMLDKNGNIYQEATEPILDNVLTNTDFFMGWLVGRRIAGQRKKKTDAPSGEPVAYLYNDVRLPKIPSDVMTYPYVVLHYLTDASGGTILAYGYDTEPHTELYVQPIGNKAYDVLRINEGTYRAGNWYDTLPDEWYVTDIGNVTDAALGYHSCTLSKIIWANFDIYTSDGTLFLAASEPVPVYE